MERLDHSIRLWNRLDGTFEVTHHKQKNSESHLFDIASDFRDKMNLSEAIAYMVKLAKRLKNARIIEFDFDDWGYQSEHGWSHIKRSGNQLPLSVILEAIGKAKKGIRDKLIH